MSNTANWIALLPQHIQDEVTATFKIKHFSDGEHIYRKGESGAGADQYQILSGTVRLRVIADNGKEATYVIYGEGDCIGFLSAIDNDVRPQDVIAIGEVKVGKILSKDFEQLTEKYPIIYKTLCEHVAYRIREVFNMYEYGLFFNLERRLANQILFLLAFSATNVPNSACQELEFTQEMLASSVGATRQAINKLLKDWSDAGFIEYHYGKIRILDSKPLVKISGVDKMITSQVAVKAIAS
ncbi:MULTISPECIES: Crp/Fnr family transcriptional regulator [unclassified Shewanella]|uniref:Crp/Fnr family transcriptional regulator n=1 Tax=unclassified Shewanella TaxID=196818 RepID=UPI000C847C01|nr:MULTISPECIES: Crp/Fnr family transcriptional regulator [unclassified Shewanella]MDO6640176.1 Crp/Fnr family transcriptional regulator [Shewanella sp. 5_MG-2023]PMG50815.1 hypothetical protein BCU91_01705 [Shewanella sp. 10N.286.52.B9]